MEGFCRGCLIKYDEPTDLLQYTEKNRRLFVYSTGLQVKRNDVFSFQLCKDCYLKMKVACNFKKMCRNSDKRVRNYQALKEAGDEMDFCTFIKNIDDSLTFRFPLLSGNSTPAFHRNNKDDDNESTCTSIRNFMTDILRADDIPDTEARIIREVIEEEADVLDDSLDSHWLQDDVSIDTDFRLDFSFSPFSTPRSVNKDRCYTPPKLNDAPTTQQHELNFYTAKKILQEEIDSHNDDQIESNNEPIHLDSLINEKEISEAIDTVLENKTESPKYEKFYVENGKISNETCNNNTKEATKCTIDRNIEKALQNEDNQEYCLDDLLVTPPVVSGGSGPSTPTINNIIFGNKLDIDYGHSNTNEPNVGHCIDNYVDVEGDVDFFEDFYYKDQDNVSKDIKTEELEEGVGDIKEAKPNESKESEMYDISKFKCKLCDMKYISARGLGLHFRVVHKTKIPWQTPKIVDDGDTKYDLLDFLCKTCNKKFDSEKALKIHLRRIHKIELPRAKRTYKDTICDVCGKIYHDHPNLMRHKKLKHEEAGIVYKCDLCSLKFTSKHTLTMHMTTHIGKMALDPPKKKYVCTICGAVKTAISNLQVHMLRHEKKYMFFCNDCGRGFYTKYNLTTHIRSHTGVRPFKCKVCEKRFARHDTLNQHMKVHTGETHYLCVHCGKKFKRHFYYMRHIKKCLTIDLRKENDLSITFVGKKRVVSVPAIIEKREFDSNEQNRKKLKLDGVAEIAHINEEVSVPAVVENTEMVDPTVTTETLTSNGAQFENEKEISVPFVEYTELPDTTIANEDQKSYSDTGVMAEDKKEVSLPAIIEVIDVFESTGSKDTNLFEDDSQFVGNNKSISLPIIVADTEV